MFEVPQPVNKKEPIPQNIWQGKTPEKFRRVVDTALRRFLKEKRVEGKEHLRDLPPDRPVIVVSSHLSNLDAPLAVDVLGQDMNLQMAVMSTHFQNVQNLMFKAAGADSFSPVTYTQKGGRRAFFDPLDFEAIQETAVKERKVPWIALHDLNVKQEMLPTGVGPAYLAQIMNAVILPIAIDVEGAGASVEGPGEIAKALFGKLKATVRIGKPIELPPFDTGPIKNVFSKRLRGESTTPEENAAFRHATQKLRDVSNQIAQNVAALLPESKRGPYKNTTKSPEAA